MLHPPVRNRALRSRLSIREIIDMPIFHGGKNGGVHGAKLGFLKVEVVKAI